MSGSASQSIDGSNTPVPTTLDDQQSVRQLTPFVQNSPQAIKVYGHGTPRQRHLFLVRFHTNCTTAWTNAHNLTFVVKHTERPKVTFKTEELSQYNKKRQIYTGVHLEPVRLTIYDSAQNAAQNLWLQYARYYSGEFAAGANEAYTYDIMQGEYRSGSGFGLSQNYNNIAQPETLGQWFFDFIEICHFYTSGKAHQYDSYKLYHPKISSFEPDDLDYEASAVSQINMAIVYENLQCTIGKPVVASDFDELFTGNFNGNPLTFPDTMTSGAPTQPRTTLDEPAEQDNTFFDRLQTALGTINAPTITQGGSDFWLANGLPLPTQPVLAAYRNDDGSGSGVLAADGYSFGTPADDPSSARSVLDGLRRTFNDVSAPSDIPDSARNVVDGLRRTFNDVSLPPDGYSALNSQQGGTAQYGYRAPQATAPVIGMPDAGAGDFRMA